MLARGNYRWGEKFFGTKCEDWTELPTVLKSVAKVNRSGNLCSFLRIQHVVNGAVFEFLRATACNVTCVKFAQEINVFET